MYTYRHMYDYMIQTDRQDRHSKTSVNEERRQKSRGLNLEKELPFFLI